MSARKKGLRLFLISAVAFTLVFCGIQFINAQQIKTMKKPVKPDPVEEPQWQVKIEPIYGEGNGIVSSTLGDVYFQENEFTEVVHGTPTRDCACYSFRLRIYPNGGQYPNLNFDGLSIEDYSYGEYGVPFGFPGCITGAPDCVARFLNEYNHPAEGYTSVLFRFWIGEEFLSGLEVGQSTTISDPGGIYDGGGYLHLSLYGEYAYETPPEGVPAYHSLYTFTSLDGLYVEKTESGWIIEFNHPLEDLIEQYTELYEYYRGSKIKIGERWAQPLTVTTNPIHFRMIWERIQ